jgi:hypothetical protein
MAKVAKKSASSAKKSVAASKSVVKKADKQKKTAVKGTTTASKKKAVTKVVKKAAPVKAVAKKVVAKKASKPAASAKKAPAKKVVTTKKVAPKAKVSAKKVEKGTSKAVSAVKKVVAPAKGKAAPAKVAKPVVSKATTPAKSVKPGKEVPQKSKVAEIKKAPVPASVVPTIAIPAKLAAKPRRKKKKDDDDDDDEEEVVFRKPVKAKVASAVKKASAKYVSEELTMEGPAPKRVGQITMTSDEKIKLKKALLNKCIDIQKNTVSIAKKAMEDALTSANAEKVTEELSDSFRESMHATRDMYARQANEGVNNLGLLNRINIVEHDKVKFGSVVFTNFQNYFISTGLGEIKVDDLSFQAVSTLAPLFQILVDKRKGDTFMFLDRLYTVVEVF